MKKGTKSRNAGGRVRPLVSLDEALGPQLKHGEPQTYASIKTLMQETKKPKQKKKGKE